MSEPTLAQQRQALISYIANLAAIARVLNEKAPR